MLLGVWWDLENFYAVLAQWQQHRFCKAAEKSYVGSSPTHGSTFQKTDRESSGIHTHNTVIRKHTQ
jgi:hypothetical protein